MTASKNSVSIAVNDVLKTSFVNGEAFILTETFEEMDHQILMHLADQMMRQLGGTLCMNTEVQFILGMEHRVDETDFNDLPFTSEDITNNVPTGNIETLNGWADMTEEERDDFTNEMQDKFDELLDNDNVDDEELRELQRLIDDANENYIENYPEIMQWFTMDDRLLHRLNEMGECILNDKYWGRCTFGQAISMDQCIMKICYDLALCWAR